MKHIRFHGQKQCVIILDYNESIKNCLLVREIEFDASCFKFIHIIQHMKLISVATVEVAEDGASLFVKLLSPPPIASFFSSEMRPVQMYARASLKEDKEATESFRLVYH